RLSGATEVCCRNDSNSVVCLKAGSGNLCNSVTKSWIETCLGTTWVAIDGSSTRQYSAGRTEMSDPQASATPQTCSLHRSRSDISDRQHDDMRQALVQSQQTQIPA